MSALGAELELQLRQLEPWLAGTASRLEICEHLMSRVTPAIFELRDVRELHALVLSVRAVQERVSAKLKARGR